MVLTLVIQQHKYIRQFTQLGATCYSKAINPEEYGIRKSVAFHKLLREEIIVETPDRRYYLDEFRASRRQKERQTILIILAIVVVSASVVMAIITGYLMTR